MAKPSNTVLKASYEVCYEEKLRGWRSSFQPKTWEVFQAKAAPLVKSSYFAIAKIMKDLLPGDELLDLFSGDSLIPATLLHAKVLKRAALVDMYRYGGTGALGQQGMRRLGLSARVRYVDEDLARPSSIEAFESCPKTSSLINTGLSLPPELRSVRDSTVLDAVDCFVSPHHFDIDESARGQLQILRLCLPNDSQLLFTDVIPPSKWNHPKANLEVIRRDFEAVLRGTLWKLEHIEKTAGQPPVIFGVLKADLAPDILELVQYIQRV